MLRQEVVRYLEKAGIIKEHEDRDKIMIAAIYARKSTEQAGVADDQKSVVRQIDHARQYAACRGEAGARAVARVAARQLD